VELSMTCLPDTLSCGLKHFSLFYNVAVYTETRMQANSKIPCTHTSLSILNGTVIKDDTEM
jgi:hypothetical protein